MTYQFDTFDPFEALAPASRREILDKLAQGPMSVGDIANGMDISRPAVSQHLKVLKQARMVSEQRQGVHRIYRFEREGLESLRSWLDRFWDEPLARFRKSLEEDTNA